MLHTAGVLHMIILAPADAFTLQWHYHYRHNCIFKPPRDAPLLQNPLAHHNTLPLGRRRGFPTRLDITLWEWIKHGHFPPLSLPFIDCLAETRQRMTHLSSKAFVKLNTATPCVFLSAKKFWEHILKPWDCEVFDICLSQQLLGGVWLKPHNLTIPFCTQK